MNKSSDIAFSAAYDAWGKQTISKSTLNLRRGYCQHEHWDEFDLIDMNGRMYDPSVGRFLSPDPYVQNATNPQNFNRYSYCLNNPLKYTDPSGMKVSPGYTVFDSGLRLDKKQVCPRYDDVRGGSGGGGGSGYGGSYGSYGSYGGYGSSPVSYDGFGYTLYDPKTINEFYASGMSLSDWIDQMVYEDKAIYTKMLDEVTVRAYDQSSYNRAAENISQQVQRHYNSIVSGSEGSGGGLSVANAANGSLSFATGMQQTLLEYTVRTNFKTARTYSEFGKLRPTQQAWRTNNAIGKGGARYLKAMKGLGKACFGYTIVSSYNSVNDAIINDSPDKGWIITKATIDVAMGAIGVWGGPIGWGVSGAYFLVDVCGGWDCIYNAIKEDY